MRDFKKLDVWSKSHNFTLNIYKIIKSFPLDERFSLADQIRRASVSIPANIAEGCGKSTPKEKVRYFTIAFGSASECEYYLILSRDLNYTEENIYLDLAKLIEEIKRMLSGLINKVQADY